MQHHFTSGRVLFAASLLWMAAAIVVSLTVGSLKADEITIARVPNPPLEADRRNLPGDLRAVAVPGPPDLSEYVRDAQLALALGKALFWDMQVGSDGVQACASCHFRAGADPRSKNQVSPGLQQMRVAPDLTLEAVPDHTYTTGGGPNGQLQLSDFPLTRLTDTTERGTIDLLADSNDVVSSQGVHHLGGGPDPDGFDVAGIHTRRVEPRNTPSVINAVFNHRQFWDGRADNVFNGVNHLGQRDPGARVYRADDPRVLVEVRVELVNSSLASQAVAPIISTLEMSAPGRTTQEIGSELARTPRKIFKRIQSERPLAKQQVHPEDSVLGPMSRWPQRGLTARTYDEMVRAAFHERWWRSARLIIVHPDGSKVIADKADADPGTEEYTLIQHNFALFFGIAVQMYEATLISDDTPWDRFRRENSSFSDPDLNPWTNTTPAHITRQALFGAHLFNDRTRSLTNIRCSNCHEQSELTDASVSRIASAANGPVRNRDGNIIDKGFNNIGVRPTSEDLGVGAKDVFGPLSFSRRRFTGTLPEFFDPETGTNRAPVSKGFGVDGAFKIPSLRNVALTAPYFHNGDARTLHEVMEFYSRGGNLAGLSQMDGTPIEPLGVPRLSLPEIDALVAFMEALTDERVLYRRAPFDHPQLFVPNGHPGDARATTDLNGDGLADDLMVEIPAVGARGGAPLPGFLEGIFGPPPKPVRSP